MYAEERERERDDARERARAERDDARAAREAEERGEFRKALVAQGEQQAAAIAQQNQVNAGFMAALQALTSALVPARGATSPNMGTENTIPSL